MEFFLLFWGEGGGGGGGVGFLCKYFCDVPVCNN